MKKQIRNLILAVLSAVTILSSCNSENISEENNTTKDKSEVTALGGVKRNAGGTFKKEFISIPETYNIVGEIRNGNNAYTLLNGKYYFSGRSYIEPETAQDILFAIGENVQISELEIIKSPYTGDSAVQLCVPLSDGGYLISYIDANGGFVYQPSKIVRLAKDGTTVFSLNIVALFDVDLTAPEMTGIDGFQIISAVEHNGNFYIASNKGAVAVSASGEKLGEFTLPQYTLRSMMYSSDEKLIFAFEDRNAPIPQIKFYFADLEKNTLGDEIKFDIQYKMANTYHAGEGYDLYCNTETGLYGINSDKAPVLLIDWINSDISAVSVISIVVISPEKFLCLTQNTLTWKTEFILLTQIPEDEITKKQIVTLAHFGEDDTLKEYVIDFNRKNQNHQVILTDYSIYSTNDDYFRGWQIMSNDIIAGDVPDIIQYGDIYSDSSGIKNLVQKGVFADLYTFFDNQLPITDYMECLQKPLEYNGKLPILVPEFKLKVNVGKRENLPELDDGKWTHDEMAERYLSLLNEGKLLYQDVPLMCADISYFVDEENAKTNFDNDTFKKILEASRQYFNNQNIISEYWQSEARYEALRNDKLMIANGEWVGALSDILRLESIFGSDDLVYFDAPDSEFLCSLLFTFGYGITEKAQNKDGSWEFLKSLTDTEIRESIHRQNSNMFPARKSNFESLMKEQLHYESVQDIDVWGVTEKEVETLRSLMKNVSYSYQSYIKISNIIDEEISSLIENTSQTTDQTAKAIQSRASIFISETYG